MCRGGCFRALFQYLVRFCDNRLCGFPQKSAAGKRVIGPQEPRGDGACGTPAFGYFLEFFRGRALRELEMVLNGELKSEIARRERIPPRQCEEKIDVGGPRTNAVNGGEPFDDDLLVGSIQCRE